MSTTTNDITIYRADWVLPVSASVMADGALAVSGERILGVGPAADLIAAHPSSTVVDMGPAIIMPGFVNCHCHIEYTSFRGILDDLEFGDWIIRLVDMKASLTPEEYLVSSRLGVIEAISSGITTLADTSYGGAALEALTEAGLRGRVYLEVFGIDDTRVDADDGRGRTAPRGSPGVAPAQLDIGLTPHSPYTVSSRLYQAISALARDAGSTS